MVRVAREAGCAPSIARHGAATMDTLISLGTLAAFGWSLYALFLGTAGQIGITNQFSFAMGGTDGADSLYLEVAAGVTRSS